MNFWMKQMTGEISVNAPTYKRMRLYFFTNHVAPLQMFRNIWHCKPAAGLNRLHPWLEDRKLAVRILLPVQVGRMGTDGWIWAQGKCDWSSCQGTSDGHRSANTCTAERKLGLPPPDDWMRRRQLDFPLSHCQFVSVHYISNVSFLSKALQKKKKYFFVCWFFFFGTHISFLIEWMNYTFHSYSAFRKEHFTQCQFGIESLPCSFCGAAIFLSLSKRTRCRGMTTHKRPGKTKNQPEWEIVKKNISGSGGREWPVKPVAVQKVTTGHRSHQGKFHWATLCCCSERALWSLKDVFVYLAASASSRKVERREQRDSHWEPNGGSESSV